MEAVTNEELEKNMEGIAGLMPEEKNDEDKDDNMRLVIRRTKSLIHEFYARGITLDEIAEKLMEKGVQIIENNVKILDNESVLTIEGNVTAEELIGQTKATTETEGEQIPDERSGNDD